jgi:hypothetical protein
VIDDNGLVGIGTTVPFADLHVSSTSPVIRFDDTTSGSGKADLYMTGNTFALIGNHPWPLVSIDTRAPFTAFKIHESGRVGIGFLAPEALLHVGGNARVDGDFSVGSSRALKTDLRPVSALEILANIAVLPVASWRYRSEDETARHIGPFAEDFHELFGLGDGETISMVDAQGVAFAAIQGLEQRLAEKDMELHRLRSEKDAQIAELTERLTAQNTAFAARLAAIEAVVQRPPSVEFEY